MLIRCATYVAGTQPPASPTVHLPVDSARLFRFTVDAGRAYVNVTQLDDDPATGIGISFGIVPPAPAAGGPSPGWPATQSGIWLTAVWWDTITKALEVGPRP